jgi:hypothetical protein
MPEKKYINNNIPETQRISQHLTEDIKNHIKTYYKSTPRTKLAKQVGINKLAFNQICIEMGLGA